MSTLVGKTPDMADVARMAGEAMEGWLRDYEGYRGLIVFTDEEGQRARVMTLWDTADAEQRARVSRGEMRDRMAATTGMTVEGMEIYEVPVFALADEPPP
jgi:hypothetical protein